MTSSPATSPNISVSGSNMSPICSEEGPSVSPPLPPRVPASLGGMERVMPTSLASSTMPDSSQFLPDPSSLAQHLSGAYPRLPMPGLASSLPGLASAGMPGLPYSSSEQSPYSSISMENFYSPLVSPSSCMLPSPLTNNGFMCRPTRTVLKRVVAVRCQPLGVNRFKEEPLVRRLTPPTPTTPPALPRTGTGAPTDWLPPERTLPGSQRLL